MTADERAELVAWMRANGVVEYPTEHGPLKLAPAIPRPTPARQTTRPVSQKCKCGHDKVLEHTAEGCLFGCEVDACGPVKE